MNASLLNRLFEAIAYDDMYTLRQLAYTIISDERKKKHTKIANQLESILENSSKKTKSLPNKNHSSSGITRSITALPMSRRYNETMARLIEPSMLKHHMVLLPEIEKRFDTIEKEYAARERLMQYGLKPKRKILLYGEPGCGKTLGAERLAWNLGLPLMKVKFDTIISSYLGESASNLRSIFETSQSIPCVLLLDECDFIAKSRMTGQDVGEIPRIVNMLLTLLDEYDAPGLLIATTNLQQTLDPALFRRFDDIIEIVKPTKNEIVELFRMTLSSFKVANSINWNKLASMVEGYSAANIVKISENAAKASVLESSKCITQIHIENAIKEMSVH